jgi:hypothetical protein
MPVQTFGSEVIRHLQRLAQAICLQFSKRSFLWKLLALWNSLRSATLIPPRRKLLLVTEGRCNGGTQICVIIYIGHNDL